LKAAASGLAITRLALYEPPFRTDEEHPALASGSLTSSRLVAEKDAVYDATIIGDLSMPAGLIASIENTDARDLQRKAPAVQCSRGTRRRGRTSLRAAPQPGGLRPQHQPRNHGAGRGRLPRKLTAARSRSRRRSEN
jgi:hypothetical protein